MWVRALCKASCRFTHIGLTDVLMGKKTFEEAVYKDSGIKDFDILESGKFKMAAFELLRGDMFKKLLEERRPQYDKIIIDTPPLGDLGDISMSTIQANPDIDYTLEYTTDSNKFVFTSMEVRKELEGVSLMEPEILLWIKEYINQGIEQAKEDTL